MFEDKIQKYWIILLTINVARSFFFDSYSVEDFRDCLMALISLMMPLLMFYYNKKTLKSMMFSRGVLSIIVAYSSYLISKVSSMYGFIDVPHILMPFALYALFTPFLKWRWRFIIIGICVLSLLFDISVRANVLLVSFCILLTLFITFLPKITEKCFKLLWVVLLMAPVALAVLSYMGIINPYSALESNNIEISIVGSKERESLTIDSRTGVYMEYLNSADNIKTILIGDGPTSDFSTSSGSVASSFSAYSRREVEAGILNILKRYGFLGGFIFFLLIYRGSKMALFDSNNTISKLLALYISFKFFFVFIEESTITLDTYMAIGLCFNSEFRKLSNNEIKRIFR